MALGRFLRLSAFLVPLTACFLASLAWLPQPADDASFLGALHDIDVFDHSKLTAANLRSRILNRRPLIVNLGSLEGDAELRGESLGRNMSQALVGVCGSKTYSPMSGSTFTTLSAVMEWNIIHMLFRLFFGESLSEWFNRISTDRTFQSFAEDMQRSEATGPRVKPFLPWLVSRLSSTIATYVEGFKVVYFSPPYVADLLLEEVCPDLLDSPAIGHHEIQARLAPFLDDAWIRRGLPDFDVTPAAGDMAPRLFWGGTHAITYPLHVDHADGDVFMYILSGCKEVVVLNYQAHVEEDYVSQFQFPGTTAFGLDVFDHPAPPPGSVSGFRATLLPGQLLFMPAWHRHVIRNGCPDTVAVAQRPWRTTAIYELRERNVKKR